jgi:hypothetical protein
MSELERDNDKISREEILKSPGTISAKIVYNIMFDNDFELYYIGGVMGNVLYTVQLNNKEKALVAFTSADLLQSYINRNQMQPKIKKSFGKKLACVKIAINVVSQLITQTESKIAGGMLPPVGGGRPLDTVIINPNMKDKFIPISISYTSSLMGDTEFDDDPLDFGTLRISMEDVDILEYDKEDRVYLFKEDDGDMIG